MAVDKYRQSCMHNRYITQQICYEYIVKQYASVNHCSLRCELENVFCIYVFTIVPNDAEHMSVCFVRSSLSI